MKLAVLNTKGGASKSTVSFQVGCTYFLDKGLPVQLLEFDDENKDSEHFSKSKIESKQIEVNAGDGLNDRLREILLNDENLVLDVGGNKTTTLVLEALKSSRMYRKIDLFIIPMSGGSQDVKNAIKTYNMIKEIDKSAKVIFALSRVRNPKRISFQYRDYFVTSESKENEHFVLNDSDVIDMSRNEQRSVYEIAKDTKYKANLEKAFDAALDKNDNERSNTYSIMLEINDEAIGYLSVLEKAYAIIDKVVATDKKEK